MAHLLFGGVYDLPVPDVASVYGDGVEERSTSVPGGSGCDRVRPCLSINYDYTPINPICQIEIILNCLCGIAALPESAAPETRDNRGLVRQQTIAAPVGSANISAAQPQPPKYPCDVAAAKQDRNLEKLDSVDPLCYTGAASTRGQLPVRIGRINAMPQGKQSLLSPTTLTVGSSSIAASQGFRLMAGASSLEAKW